REAEAPARPRNDRRKCLENPGGERVNEVRSSRLPRWRPIRTDEQLAVGGDDRATEPERRRWRRRRDDPLERRRLDVEEVDRPRAVNAENTLARGTDEHRSIGLSDDGTEGGPCDGNGRSQRAERSAGSRVEYPDDASPVEAVGRGARHTHEKQ